MASIDSRNVFSGKIKGQFNIVPEVTPTKTILPKTSSPETAKTSKSYALNYSLYSGVINLKHMIEALKLEKFGLSKGQLMVDSIAESQGTTTKELLDHLTGRVKIGVKDLDYQFISSENPITKFFSLLSGSGFNNKLNLKCGAFQASAKEGNFIINPNTSTLNLSGAIVNFAGDINLLKQTLDMSLTPSAKFINLSTFVPPLTIAGNFNNIYIYPNTMKTAVEVGIGAAIMATGIGAIGVVGYKLAQGTKTAITSSCDTTLQPLPEKYIQAQESTFQKITSGTLNTLGL